MVDLVYTHFAFFRNYQRDVRLRVGLPHASNPSSTDFIPVLELGIQNTAVESAWPEAVNRFVLSQAALDKIHGLLARHDPNIDRLYALNLLFCAVGLAFEPAQSPGERDEFLDLGLEWNAFQGSEGWLGENFRRVCGLDALPKEGPKTGSDSDSDSDSDYDSENTEYGEGEVQMMGAIQDEMWADNSDEGSEEESESEEQDDEML
ncbi:hypothetical protein K438DRAFT_1831845 [Mycena galopus ATCC 62051]|nr:hypothetical protein K438DRAFT_1831845 [Mycena galopus ATCC 62051]